MSSSLDDLPEINELIVLDLAIVVIVNSVEELLCRNFTKEKLRPMLHCFILIDCFWTVFVKYPEHFIHNCNQLWWQFLQHSQICGLIKGEFLPLWGLALISFLPLYPTNKLIIEFKSYNKENYFNGLCNRHICILSRI